MANVADAVLLSNNGVTATTQRRSGEIPWIPSIGYEVNFERLDPSLPMRARCCVSPSAIWNNTRPSAAKCGRDSPDEAINRGAELRSEEASQICEGLAGACVEKSTSFASSDTSYSTMG